MRLATLLDLALRMSGEGRDSDRPGLMRRLLYFAAGCLSLTLAALLALLALFLALLPELGEVKALLVVAAIPAIIGAVFATLARQKKRHLDSAPRSRALQKGGELEALIRDHKGAALLALFAAAFQQGVSSRKK